MQNNTIEEIIFSTRKCSEKASELATDIFSSQIISDDQRKIFEFFFDLLDCNVDSRSVYYALDGTEDLLNELIEKLDIKKEISEKLTENFKVFRKVISGLPDDHSFKEKPLSKNNVVIYFLSKRRKQIRDLPDGKMRWNKTVIPGFLATKLAVKSSSSTQEQQWKRLKDRGQITTDFVPRTDEQIQELTRPLIKVLMYIELSALPDKASLPIEDAAIKQALEKSNESGPRFDASFDSYYKFASSLFNQKQLNRPRLKPFIKNAALSFLIESEDVDFLSLTVKEKEEFQGYIKKTNDIFLDLEASGSDVSNSSENEDIEADEEWMKIGEEEIDDGEAADEVFLPPLDSEKFNLRRGMAERARRLRPLSWTPPWDKSLLTDETLGIMIARLFDASRNENPLGENSELLLIILLQTFFGFSLKTLVAIKYKKSAAPKDDKNNPVVYHAGCFYIHPEKYDHKPLFGSTDSAHAAHCLLGSHFLRIPAPPILKILIDKKLTSIKIQNGFLFSPDNNMSIACEPPMFSAKLLLIKDYFAEKIDFNKISRTAINHFSAEIDSDELVAFELSREAEDFSSRKAPLDPLITAFISGSVPQHLGAQGHYFNVTQEEISRRHAKACIIRWEQIKEASTKEISVLQLSDLKEVEAAVLAEECLHIIHSDDQLNSRKNKEDLSRFGSPFVPLEKSLINYLNSLCEAFKDAECPILRFNLMTAYTALSVMHLLGLRGVEAERFNVRKIHIYADGSALLLIIGKSNKKFTEWRIGYLPKEFGALIEDYEVAAKTIGKYLVDKSLVYPAEIKAQRGKFLFFFVEDSGESVYALTRENLKKQISTILPEKTSCSPFLWKINAPRQFFAYTAFNAGLSRQKIDALMGHSSQGLELLAKFSGTSFEKFKRAADLVASKANQILNIKILSGE